MNRTTKIAVVAAAYAVGVAAGIALSPGKAAGAAPETPQPEEAAPAKPGPGKEEPDDFSGEVAAMKEKNLRRTQRQIESKENEIVAPKLHVNGRESVRARMEQLRAAAQRMRDEDAPETQAEALQRIKDLQARLNATAGSKLDILESIDTSGMNAAQLATHKKLVKQLNDYAKLSCQLHEPPPEFASEREKFAFARERHALADGLHDLVEDIRKTNRKERSTLIEMAASALGFAPDEASALADSVFALYEATDPRQFRPVSNEVTVDISMDPDGAAKLVTGPYAERRAKMDDNGSMVKASGKAQGDDKGKEAAQP